MKLWTELEELHARHDVLKHPFYQRWSNGELTLNELSRYAGQYRHGVVALAEAATHASAAGEQHPSRRASRQLSQHASEEVEHIELWDQFTEAVGGCVEAPPTPETVMCARTWAADAERPLLRSLIALHTIEATQPAIAATKRAGLVDHYGVAEGPATAYFDLHEHLDVHHARASRELIDEALQNDAPERRLAKQVEDLLGEAEAVLRANWLLLDGVERVSGKTDASCAYDADHIRKSLRSERRASIAPRHS